MSASVRLALLSAAVAALTFSAQAAAFPTVPSAELSAFCHQYGAARAHLATFFLADGLRLRGHVNCTTATFTLNLILPPIE
jgi:hypothetical protein